MGMASAQIPQSGSADLPTFLTASEVADVLRMTAYEVSRLCREGKIKATRPGRAWLISRAALDDYIAAASNEDVA